MHVSGIFNCFTFRNTSYLQESNVYRTAWKKEFKFSFIAYYRCRKYGVGKCSCRSVTDCQDASCRARIMSTTPKKIYSIEGEKFCRLCGSEKDVDCSTNVFRKSGIRKNLAKTISELLQVTIKEDVGLPSNICRQCEGKLSGFSEFKSSVISMQSQAQLTSSSTDREK